MAYSDFDKLKVFFLALNKSSYHPERMDPEIITPGDKAYCFNWLREKIPELKEKNDKDIIEFLRDPKKVKERILGKLAKEEGAELTKILDEKPLAKEGIVYQQDQEAPAGQVPQESASGGSAGGMPGTNMPSAPSVSSMPRRVYKVPHTPETASDISATEQIKTEVPQAFQKAFENEPEDVLHPDKTQAPQTKPSTQKFNPSSLKSSASSAFQKTKTFVSGANPFLKTNLSRIANGLTQSVLPSVASAGGRAGLRAFHHGGNFLNNVSNARLRASTTSRSLAQKAGSKKWLLAGGTFFLLFFMSAIGGAMSDTSTGEASTLPSPSTSAPPYQPGAGKGVISCPLNQGAMTLGSKDAPGEEGHCSANYQKSYPCASPDLTGRATAIDLQSPDRNVFFPYLNGEIVTWTVTESGTAINESEGGGYALAATASSKGKNYRIRFVHINKPTFNVNATMESAKLVSQHLGAPTSHVHITLQEDGEFRPADLYFNLCQ